MDEVARHRVTYEMDAGKSEKSENQNPISQYYQKNHYTVTGNQETYQKLPRNISANRFQVDKASISQKSAPRASEPMEMPMLPQERRKSVSKKNYNFLKAIKMFIRQIKSLAENVGGKFKFLSKKFKFYKDDSFKF